MPTTLNNTLPPIELQKHNDIPQVGPEFSEFLTQQQYHLRHKSCQELQINLGKMCNLACHHCHVEAGPKRTEIMQWETMQKILQWIKKSDVKRVDLTGGAPELNPYFKQFCHALLQQSIEITSRCNITVLFEKGQEDLAQWYADNGIRLVCSLPCYSAENVEAQRGKGVFKQSIDGLQVLNALGYGDTLTLDLVYNPAGAYLPPEQSVLEAEYKQRLQHDFGIIFDNLLTITNIPINRFVHALKRGGTLTQYQQLLVDNFNIDTLEGLMCQHVLNVDWLGKVYDCDFNQMLDLIFDHGNSGDYLWDTHPDEIKDRPIRTDRHCFGCTAGAGSSCGGSLA